MIGYCTNIHPEFRPEFWRQLNCPIGLWLPAHAIPTADRSLLREFEIFTLNGFPYGDFHGPRVKYDVYEPNWCDPRRVEYTIDLAKLLCEVSSVEEPTISTLPIGWTADLELAAKNLFQVAQQLSHLQKKVMICLEPEPGCVLESAADVVKFFEGPLARYDQALIRQHIGVCWDTCHHAVIFEPPEKVAALYAQHQITVGKMQVSCALALPEPKNHLAELMRFDEPRYLHQTRDGISGCDDLPQAPAKLSPDRAWRSHFHVPVDRPSLGALSTTQDETVRAIQLSPTKIFEVETYTWSVLPDAPQDDASLMEGIRRELEWARKNS